MEVILYKNADGGVFIITPAININISLKDIPKGSKYKIVNTSKVINDHTFYGAWEYSDSKIININIEKAKTIAHVKRRIKRAKELAPFDIQATIPSEAVEAESARVLIREKYAIMQADIDESSTITNLKKIIKNIL